MAVFSDAEIISLPVSDGGDGFVDALASGLTICEYEVVVSNPLGNMIPASFLFSSEKKLAVIEMTKSSGLALLSKQLEKNALEPMKASTFGFGEMIMAALDLGAKDFILGIGGSATSDGGTGMATALGVQFLDVEGNVLYGNAENLTKISRIDCSNMDRRLREVSFEVACDVTNPLLGENGSAMVYAPQKGASEEEVQAIECGLSNLADVIERDLGVDVRSIAGAGAAGGVGAALTAFLNAKIKSGADLLLDFLKFDDALLGADLVITAEGKLDSQTGFGKAPFVVANRAKKLNVPTVMMAGLVELSESEQRDIDFANAYAICDKDMSVDYAMSHASSLLTRKTSEAMLHFFSKN